MRYKAKISYDGSLYYGFQRLNELPTIQNELEKAVSIINKKETFVKGASRTDKGVHAYGQVIHFNLDYVVPVDRLMRAMNAILPRDIRILEIESVSDDFHARRSALGKKYVYKINLGEYSVFLDRYYLQYPYKLDIEAMRKCSKVFLGVHNFKNFTAGERDNYEAVVKEINFIRNGDYLEIEFVGKSFYRYMVRNMVGAMIDVARGKHILKEVEVLLEKPEKKGKMMKASPNGLYLVCVYYTGG